MAERVASLYAEIGADTTKLQRGLKDAKTGLAGFVANNKMAISTLSAFASAGIAAGAAVKAIADQTADYNRQVREGSQVTGLAVEEFSRLVQVGDDWGITSDEITTSLAMMRQKGLQPSVDALAELADEFVAAGNTTAFAEKAVNTLGRGWKTLVPLLAKGGDALRDQVDAVDESLIATEDSIQAARDYEVALDDWNDSVLGLKMSIGNELLPELTRLLNDINTLDEANTRLVVGNDVAAARMRKMRDAVATLDRPIDSATQSYMAMAEAVKETTVALEAGEPPVYDYRYVVTDVDHEARRAAQAVENFAIGVDRTAEAADKAKGPLDDFLDGVDRNIDSPIAGFIKDLEWFMAGGGKIEQAFADVQAALAAGKITPEQAKMFSEELYVATQDLQLELDNIDAKQAAANLDETLGAQARKIAMQEIRGTEGIEGALASITGIQYYLDFKFRYSGTPPGSYTGSEVAVPVGPNPRAAGGPVMAGMPYIVGERGPELFVPGKSGGIVPNNQLGGGGDVYADITINAAPGMDVNAIAAAVVAKLGYASRNNRAGGAYRGA